MRPNEAQGCRIGIERDVFFEPGRCMRKPCEACGRAPHSETAFTLSARCHGCGRFVCPDCQRNLIADNGNRVGVYCPACADEARGKWGCRFAQPYRGLRDSIGRPVLRGELEGNRVTPSAYQFFR